VKALVTGANGFVGSHLCEHLLAQGDSVRVLVRKSADLSALDSLGVTRAIGDVTDAASIAAALDGIDTIFHVAGRTKVARASEFTAVNVGGCANVAREASRRATPPAVVVISSLAAAGPSPGFDPPRDEDLPPSPVSDYGWSKLEGERAARAWGGVVPLSIVRPPLVYGPRDRDAFEIFKLAKRGFAPRVGFGDKRFSAVHVRDLAAGIRRVAERGERCGPARPDEPADSGRGVYFLSDGGRHTWDDLVHAAAGALGTRARVFAVPDAVTYLAGWMGEAVSRATGKPWIVNLDKAREGRASHWACSPEKARRHLGWKTAVPLQEGFAETAQFYVRAGWLK
jgi:nucleoside-diphosphate-sugar epimerase